MMHSGKVDVGSSVCNTATLPQNLSAERPQCSVLGQPGRVPRHLANPE